MRNFDCPAGQRAEDQDWGMEVTIAAALPPSRLSPELAGSRRATSLVPSEWWFQYGGRLFVMQDDSTLGTANGGRDA